MRPKPSDTGLSRQARKTYEAIKTDECVPTKSVHRLLECLGFKLPHNGTHQTWRHPKGYRVTLVFRQRDDGIWGWELNKVRKLLAEIEAKEGCVIEQRGGKNEVAMVHEKTRERFAGSEIQAWKDEKVLIEKNIPQVNKLDLSGLEQKTMLKTMSDAFNALSGNVGKLASMLQSTQEYLLELGLKLDGLKVQPAPLVTPALKPERKSLSPEDLAEARRQNGLKAQEKKRNELIQRIKETQKIHPNFAKNPEVIAALAKIGSETVKKYFKEGLV